MREDNIPKAIEEAAQRYPQKIVLEIDKKGFTYQEVLSISKSLASFLASKGIKKGERVAIFSEGRPEWGMVYLSISFLGAVVVPIDVQLMPEEVRNLIQDSESKAVFFSEKTQEGLNEAIKGISIEAISLDSRDFSEAIITSPLEVFPSISPDDTASLIYTSGTTGRPKGVELTHKNLLSNAYSIREAKLIDESDCILSILPLHHSYPFMVNLLVPLLTGARVVYQQSLKGPDILKTMVEKGVTVLVGVPQLFAMLRKGIIDKIPSPILRSSGFLRDRFGINAGRLVFSSLHKRFGKRFRFFVSGGAKLDPEVARDLEALGFTVIEGYGLTETSPVISFNPLKRLKRGSVGLPLLGVKVKIINPDREGIGEIAIRGPNVMKGYYRNPKETEKSIKDGWLFTGDLGYIDNDGYLFITGRIKEIIVLSSGKNIYPEEIEKHYLESPLIKEICVLGIEKKPGISDGLQALVLPNMDYMEEKKIADLKEAIRWEIKRLSTKLPPHKRIKGYEPYQFTLPRTPLGKLKRYAVRDILSGGALKEEEEISEEGKGIEGPRVKWKDLLRKEPSVEDQRAIGFMQGYITRLFIIVAIGLLRIVGKICFRLEVRGIENLPRPPYIITPNHASYLDGFIIGLFVPIRAFMNLYFLGFRRYFSNWFTSRFAGIAHVIPIEPETHLRGVLQILGYVLRNGKSLCIFPEGGRTYDGALQPFKKGIGILSKGLDVPLVPTLIEGTYDVLPRGAIWPRFRKIRVTFGRPIPPGMIDFSRKPEGMDDYEWIASQVRDAISGMKG